ncbi:MAG: hypothetical protein H0U54_00425 [Acidobacteria bacterium]|nr:hypothetical protein [Acidobacteriota bacterium]
MGDEVVSFLTCQHDGNTNRALGSFDAINEWEFDLSNIAVEEKDRGECLVLRRGSDLTLSG